MKFFEFLQQYRRIAIAGGPKTGKTTLADTSTPGGPRIIHTDEIEAPWAELPDLIVEECRNSAAYVVEGVQVGRALRKGLNPEVVVYLNQPFGQLTKGQASMSRGCATIFRSWLDTGPDVPAYLLSAREGGDFPDFLQIS